VHERQPTRAVGRLGHEGSGRGGLQRVEGIVGVDSRLARKQVDVEFAPMTAAASRTLRMAATSALLECVERVVAVAREVPRIAGERHAHGQLVEGGVVSWLVRRDHKRMKHA
jgi:hypothetical protein